MRNTRSQSPSFEEFLFQGLERAAQLNSIVNEICRMHDITGQQWFIMQLLMRAPKEELTVSQISNKMRVTKGNVTGIVTRMEEKELVERIGSQIDKRVVYVRLTKRGAETLKNVSNFIKLMHEKLQGSSEKPLLLPAFPESFEATIGFIDAAMNELLPMRNNKKRNKKELTDETF